MTPEKIESANRTHVISTEDYGEHYIYRLSFTVDANFKESKIHAAEGVMLCTYEPDPNEEYGHEGQMPCIAVMRDETIYNAVEEFKKTGKIPNAAEITPLSGKFLFRAVAEYFGDMMHFYGYDSCDGFWENTGLCLIYPKEYAGTENEKKLIQIFEEAASSYREERLEKIEDDNEKEDVAKPERSYSYETTNSYSETEYTSPDLTDRPVETNTIARTAYRIRTLLLMARLIALVALIILIIDGKIANNFKIHHLVQLNGTEEVISDFTAEEQNDILKAFDVVIPENETDAHLASFMRKTINDKAASYVIEIDDVKDYDAFFSANSERDLGKSVNEIDSEKRKAKYKYYITYNELIASDANKRQKNKNSENYDQIEELFNFMVNK